MASLSALELLLWVPQSHPSRCSTMDEDMDALVDGLFEDALMSDEAAPGKPVAPATSPTPTTAEAPPPAPPPPPAAEAGEAAATPEAAAPPPPAVPVAARPAPAVASPPAADSRGAAAAFEAAAAQLSGPAGVSSPVSTPAATTPAPAATTLAQATVASSAAPPPRENVAAPPLDPLDGLEFEDPLLALAAAPVQPVAASTRSPSGTFAPRPRGSNSGISAAGAGEDKERKQGGALPGAKAPNLEVFDMRGSETPTNEAAGTTGTAAGGTVDWYGLDEADANNKLQQTSSTADDAEAADKPGSPKKGALPSWASKLGKKARKLGSEAKKAVVEEAKLLADDAKDLAEGVREGMQLTVQDAKAKGWQPPQRAAGGWRGLLGGIGGSKGSANNKAAEVAGTPDLLGDGETTTAETSASESPVPAGEEQASASDLAEHTRSTNVKDAAEPEQEDQSQPQAASKGPGALHALRQSLAATADASKEMFKDLREANRDVVEDLRQNVGALGRAAAAWRAEHAAASKDQGAGAAATEAEEAALQSSAAAEADEADAAHADTGPAKPASADEAQVMPSVSDTLDPQNATAAESDIAEVGSQGSRTTASERRFDEQTQQAAERVKAVAQATKKVSEEFLRKTAGGIRAGIQQMTAVPLVTRSKCPGCKTLLEFDGIPYDSVVLCGKCGTQFTPGQQQAINEASVAEFLQAPSCRSNYVAMFVEMPPLPSPSPQPEESQEDDQDAARRINENAEAAVRRVRKLGGRLAKRGKEVSSGLIKQARDLGQNIQANIASDGAGGNGSDSQVGIAGHGEEAQGGEAEPDEDIFEIGDDDDADWSDEEGGGDLGGGEGATEPEHEVAAPGPSSSGTSVAAS